jgi:hypothetical protein
VPLSSKAKQPATLFSVKYFPSESSVFTLLVEHPKKIKQKTAIIDPFIIIQLAQRYLYSIDQGNKKATPGRCLISSFKGMF